MIVGIVDIEMHIPQAGSLKEKRSVINSLKSRIQNKFNVSIAEVDYFDKWQRAAFGLSTVSTDKSHIDSILSEIESFIAHDFRVVITAWNVRFN